MRTREYYAVKIDRRTGRCELLDTMQAENGIDAKRAFARKYPEIIRDMLNTAMAVVGRDGYRTHYMEKCTGEKPEEEIWKDCWN